RAYGAVRELTETRARDERRAGGWAGGFETPYLLLSRRLPRLSSALVSALTGFGWSHTLNVLLVRHDGRSCGPFDGAFGVEGIGAALRSIVAQTHLSTQSAPAPSCPWL